MILNDCHSKEDEDLEIKVRAVYVPSRDGEYTHIAFPSRTRNGVGKSGAISHSCQDMTWHQVCSIPDGPAIKLRLSESNLPEHHDVCHARGIHAGLQIVTAS